MKVYSNKENAYTIMLSERKVQNEVLIEAGLQSIRICRNLIVYLRFIFHCI